MNRHYLDAMLTADRMMDMQNAIAQPAALNTDFNPVLYFYHLRHWMSQFKIGFGALQVLLLVLLCFYLVRLRGTAFVLFASGFAATALEIVLLLAFQVLCGSVYHQLGIIVTVFMAGLALGAALANRRMKSRSNECVDRSVRPPLNWKTSGSSRLCHRRLRPPARVFIAAVEPAGGHGLVTRFIKAAIALLTLILALLVGMQFPLANRLEFDGTVAGASRLYTADFVGAFLGALLAGTLLIPLIGVTGGCLLTAALNFTGGVNEVFQPKVPI